MNTEIFFVLLIILTSCIAILTVLIIILYCMTSKYIRKPMVFSEISVEKHIEKKQVKEENIEKEHSYQPQFGSTILETEEVDVIQSAKDAIESMTPFAETQKIKLHLFSDCEKLMIMAVPGSIRILFRNIIDNSIKYMGRPGHMIITISLVGNDIFLILKDTGKGLNEEETPHIFELNFQGSNRVSGNGLGLTQSKMIVEAFGGTIYAKSSPENGMAIYIQLPVSKKSDSI